MARIHADPVSTSLMHPTRRALYVALLEADEYTTPQNICGMTSQSEWTGVMLSTLLKEVGVKPSASWLLAEGTDAAVLTRSIPKQIWNESMIVYAQNGEDIRHTNGYPSRLLNPG